MSIIAQDTFTSVGTIDLGAHVGDTGHSWVSMTAADGAYMINKHAVSGGLVYKKAAESGGGAYAFSTMIPTTTAIQDGYVEVEFTRSSEIYYNAYVGVMIRGNFLNYYGIYYRATLYIPGGGDSATLFLSDGNDTDLTGSNGITVPMNLLGTHTLRIAAAGNVITVSIDGLTRLTFTDTEDLTNPLSFQRQATAGTYGFVVDSGGNFADPGTLNITRFTAADNVTPPPAEFWTAFKAATETLS